MSKIINYKTLSTAITKAKINPNEVQEMSICTIENNRSFHIATDTLNIDWNEVANLTISARQLDLMNIDMQAIELIKNVFSELVSDEQQSPQKVTAEPEPTPQVAETPLTVEPVAVTINQFGFTEAEWATYAPNEQEYANKLLTMGLYTRPLFEQKVKEGREELVQATTPTPTPQPVAESKPLPKTGKIHEKLGIPERKWRKYSKEEKAQAKADLANGVWNAEAFDAKVEADRALQGATATPIETVIKPSLQVAEDMTSAPHITQADVAGLETAIPVEPITDIFLADIPGMN